MLPSGAAIRHAALAALRVPEAGSGGKAPRSWSGAPGRSMPHEDARPLRLRVRQKGPSYWPSVAAMMLMGSLCLWRRARAQVRTEADGGCRFGRGRSNGRFPVPANEAQVQCHKRDPVDPARGGARLHRGAHLSTWTQFTKAQPG